MVKATTPEVYLIARPAVDWGAVVSFLRSVGGAEWADRVAGAPDGELLVEFMGRLCYRSWAPGLNPNVTRVRTDSSEYLENILRSADGSMREHANYSFVFHNVSRVFTHELVRHRAGVAVSQESLRYVRLSELPFAHPEEIQRDPSLLAAANDLLERMEAFQSLVAEATGVTDAPFDEKKRLTSAARRYAPDGLSTTIGWTANVRALRHVIAMRTHVSAEAEIRVVFDQVAQIIRGELPALMADFSRSPDGEWLPRYSKV